MSLLASSWKQNTINNILCQQALGREITFVLKKGKVEMPSDIFEIVYEPLDEGEGWKIRLARELKAAGFNVDFNKAI